MSTTTASFTTLPSDFFGFAEQLSAQEKDTLARLRAFLDEQVRPRVNDLWEASDFPTDLVAPLADLGVLGFGGPETAKFENSALFRGFVAAELGRVDAGMSTFSGVTAGLVMGALRLWASDEQKQQWLHPIAEGRLIGSFGLTEPLSGSDAARGLRTTATRDGDTWVLSGEKRWIGNATWADVVVIIARDTADSQVKAFVVPTTTPGYTATKIEGKYSQRTVQNADIVLDGVVLGEEHRLPGVNSFRDVANLLLLTRLDVAWAAVGNAMGAYEAALRYTKEREQFGRPIASFQLVQSHLVRALGDITAALGMCVQSTRMLEAGTQEDHHAALTKGWVTARARDAVAHCREIVGGNGIQIDYDVIRHFADAEALYSFEGTYEMTTLMVGRAITGHSAFV